jgi:cytochrome b
MVQKMMQDMKTEKVWDIFVRICHWTLVGCMIGLYLSGDEFEGVHISLGYFVTCLILLRVIWGFIGTKHARFGDFLYPPTKIYQYLKGLVNGNPTHYLGHNPAGGLMIIVMLLFLLVTAFTGLKTLGSEGKGLLANNGISIFRFAYADDDSDDHKKYKTGDHQKNRREEFWEEIHESMTSFMISLIIVHLAGVVVSSWIHKENLILAMINGRKKT